MPVPPERTSAYSAFEYMYCDAGNWSTGGILLLTGAPTAAVSSAIIAMLESSELFVAEQVGIPSLCPKHFKDCGSAGPNDLDHAYHTFDALRPATQEEVDTLSVFSSLDEFVRRFVATNRQWDVTLSPNVSW